MPEIEIFEDKSILVGKRRKGRDETLEDAMKTMERFSDWLADSQDASRNPWLQSDPVNIAMLYGMLEHLRGEIEKVIALGGADARATHEFFRGMKQKRQGSTGAVEQGSNSPPPPSALAP